MPFITINIANRGTPVLVNPKTGLPDTSSVGHMWVVLDKGGDSKSLSYGFAPEPQHEGSPFAPGKIYNNDNSNYTNNGSSPPYYSRVVEISQAQYDSMENFGNLALSSSPNGAITLKDVSGNDQSFTLKCLHRYFLFSMAFTQSVSCRPFALS